jgi:hypothetical protein
MNRRDAEHRIRIMALLYAREEHGVTAAIEYEGYSCRITLHKRDGSDVTTTVSPRASVVEVQTAIDEAVNRVKQEPQPLNQLASLYGFASYNQLLQNAAGSLQSYQSYGAPQSQALDSYLGSGLLSGWPFK